MSPREVLRFVVPGKPVSSNEMYRRDRRGFVRKTEAAFAFAHAIAAHGARARKKARAPLLTGPVDVLITLFLANERPDGDGPVKVILDSLQPSRAHRHPAHRRIGAGIIANDRQVRDHHVRRRIDRQRPRIEVAVGPAGDVFTLAEMLEQEGGVA